MPLFYADLRSTVEKTLRRNLVEKMISFVLEKNPSLWGGDGSRNYLKKYIYLVLYKMISGRGFGAVASEFDLNLRIYAKTLSHNFNIILEELVEWANTVVVPGRLRDWQNARKKIKFPKKFPSVDLLVDSSDFRLAKKAGKRGRKSPWWSYKLNGPGIRYTFFRDLSGKIRFFFGPQSPKLYDSEFFNQKKEYLDTVMAGATVVGDQHYFKAKKYMKKVKILAPFREDKKEDPHNPGEMISQLTKDQRTFNKNLRKIRSPIEAVFGTLKSKFEILKKPFQGKKKKHSKILFVCIAWFNLTK